MDGRLSTITALESIELVVDGQDWGLSQSLTAHGYWEMWLTEAIEAAMRAGMTVIDMGANLGYFTMLMAKGVGPTGNVHAFEPNPAMATLLAESAARNGFADRVVIHGDPLWNVDGLKVALKVPTGEPKNAHLVEASEHEAGLVLATRRFDGYPNLLDADLVKIDVEGAEEAIWQGMEGLFAQGRPLTIFLEYNPGRYEDPMGFLDTIVDQGFALAELSVSYGIRTVTREQILAGPHDEDRMLALTRGRRA